MQTSSHRYIISMVAVFNQSVSKESSMEQTVSHKQLFQSVTLRPRLGQLETTWEETSYSEELSDPEQSPSVITNVPGFSQGLCLRIFRYVLAILWILTGIFLWTLWF
ncbi:protein TE6 [Testudinid alphaherpesvirus 3]|uniref:Protein TE6 n=1 Tax=Testudinid alphaherpesvirus 3 TaxID=2560801 RepID=A0A0M3LF91_9ALPH|nr:protein TE6 [Testudinid alphaherpesvirus 3]AIU39316.1 protein TE6 [Testudinid alphaherpesvirus 3]